jgi:hypothetical protein
MKKQFILAIPILVCVLLVTGCTIEGDSYSNDTSKVEATQKRVQQSVPIPEIATSAERKNISARAVLFDNENKITYIYLINYGKIMAFFTVQGKVSSLNSYLTPLDKVLDDPNGDLSAGSVVVSAPDIDGAYGENADGIFFFTTEGAYVEWKGDYMVSDQPLKLTQQVELIREIK